MSTEENIERYNAAAHAMQSGVAATMHFDKGQIEPKHMRVGVNSSLVAIGVMTKLLIDKGVISSEEYWEAMADGMEEERDSYVRILKQHYPNTDIKLH